MWTKTYKVVGFLEPGVVRFGDKNLMIYISKEAIERFSHRLKGKPITIGHIEGITEENAQQYSVGDVVLCSQPGECIVSVRDEEAARRIDDGERFSCCWIPVKWGPAGTWHNVPYDRELVEMDFTHLAIVPDPRYENVEVYMNSKSKEYNNATLKPRNDDGGLGFSRAAADSQTKVARAAQKNVYNVNTFSEQPRQHKSIGDRKVVKVSNFQNSLCPKQYAFLKKYVKEWNNGKADAGLSSSEKRDVRFNRNHSLGEAPQNKVNSMINYRAKSNTGADKSLMKSCYNNEAQPPDNSERMARIGTYLQKREDRRMDKQYKTQEAPKQYAERANTHFSGYKNSSKCHFRCKDGSEFRNNVFKDALKRWDGNGRGEKRIDSTRSLLTEQTGQMPKIGRGPQGASGRISEQKASRIARDL